MTPESCTSDDVGALLTAAAPPAPPAPAGPGDAALHAALAREVVAADRGRHPHVRRARRRHRLAVAVAATAVVLVPPGAWAAQHFLAQTGAHGDPARNPDFEDSSELVDTCAGDLVDYVATLASTDLPLAPGHTWREYAQAEAGSWVGAQGCAPGQVGLVQETALRLGLLARSSGDWGCTLVWADRDGDGAAEASARSAMTAIDTRARELATLEGTTGTSDPDVFLANSRLPQFTGCRR